MMSSMKRFLLLLGCSGLLLHGVELPAVHTVYLLPMTRGLDQYLANRLTNEHVFQVVTDPKQADAIFTDRIGEAFEEKLADLFPSPERVSHAAPKSDGPAAPKSDGPALLTETVNKLSDPVTSSTFGRARGMVFLVDPKSHHVIWSAYQPPKDTSAPQMEHAASDIVMRLKRDLKKQ
jgi:hypothetical protein